MLEAIAKEFSEILTRNLNNKLTFEVGNGIHASLMRAIKEELENGNDQRAVTEVDVTGSEQPSTD